LPYHWGNRYEETPEELSIDQDGLLDLIEDSFDALDKTNPYMALIWPLYGRSKGSVTNYTSHLKCNSERIAIVIQE
jgi:hypothetical protein